jgi:hypothetical protein
MTCNTKLIIEDTNVFATWLSSHARVCGYTSPTQFSTSERSVPTARLKGKARKDALRDTEAEPTASYETTWNEVLPTREILVQARAIAKHKPLVIMPVTIQQILCRAIDARKRCSNWFQKEKNKPENEEQDQANDAHSHFIAVLEEALNILQPCIAPSKLKKTAASKEKNGSDLSNRFRSLMVEQTNDTDGLNITAKDKLVLSTNTKSSSPATPTVYELERDLEADLIFIVFCFFEDLGELRQFLVQTWEQVAAGELEHIVASLVTNIALQFVRNAEDELANLFPKQLGERSYFSMIYLLNPAVSKYEGGVLINPAIINSAGSEFLYSSTAFILQKYKLSVMESRNKFLPCVMTANMWLNTRDPSLSKTRDLRSELKFIEEEDRILSKTLLAVHLKSIDWGIERNADTLRPEVILSGFLFHGVKDELSKALGSVPNDPVCSVWSVFAAHILVRIQLCLEKVAVNPYRELLQKGVIASKAVEMEWKKSDTELSLIPSGSFENDWINSEQQYHATILYGTVNNVIMYNNTVRYLKTCIEGTPDYFPKYPDYIHSSRDPTYYFQHNPIYSDLETLRLAVYMERAGINMINNTSSFISVAHIYNAAIQLGHLGVKWDAMDKAIEVQKRQVFNGSIPTTRKLIISRFMLRLGIPAKEFARDSRTNSCVSFMKVFHQTVVQLSTSSVTDSLELYLNSHMSAANLLNQVQANSQTRGKKYNRSPTCAQLLLELRNEISQALPMIDLDLVTLSRECSTIMRRIREAFKKQLDINDPLEGVEFAESTARYRYNLMTAFSILEDEVLTRPSSGLMAIAAKVIQSFIEIQNKKSPVEPSDVVLPTEELTKDWTGPLTEDEEVRNVQLVEGEAVGE